MIVITFVWVGFVGAISFMEAWLKFQAPNVTTELGLGIGQLVFGALNSVEIVCLILILLIGVSEERIRKTMIRNLFFISLIVLLFQTFWLLPALNVRASAIIEWREVAPSKLHLWYVLLEIVKVISLTVVGFKCLNQFKNNK